VHGCIVAALDGIEVLSSYSCQIVSSPVKSLPRFEWLEPDEGEETAALRLVRTIPDLYGSSFFDILLMEAAVIPAWRVWWRSGIKTEQVIVIAQWAAR
jgi:hypothetical protein